MCLAKAQPLCLPFLLTALPLSSSYSLAQETGNSEQKRLPTIKIFDEKFQLDSTPGSGAILNKKVIQQNAPLSTQDILRKVPGVQAVETDGYGFYPRINIRGIGSDMSRKVILLEDGAPISLGPFTDPSAYYSPPVERFERIEVLKGSGALRFGPSTISGAINYITRDPETTPGGRVSFAGGNFDYQNLFAEYGGSQGNWIGGVSVLRKQGDGWRDMPFIVNDVVAKSGWSLGDKNFVGLKFTYFDMEGQHTYTGLSEAEYRQNYKQNKAKNDQMFVDRKSLDVNHEYEISGKTTWRNLLYWNDVQRDWWRENFTFNSTTGVYDAGGRNQGRLRGFQVWGVDSRLLTEHELFGVNSKLEWGIRYHQEHMDNFRIDGKSGAASSYVRDPNELPREDDTRTADSIALFIENAFQVTEKFTVTPGLRIERYEQERDIKYWNKSFLNKSASVNNTEYVPGLGFIYKPVAEHTFFAGIHKGFAPPRVQDVVDNTGVASDLDAERSTNMELGVRGKLSRGNYEMTAFRIDFSNQLVQASQSGGAGTALTNAGETLNQGLEVAFDYYLFSDITFATNYTWLETAELTSTRIIAGQNRKGNRLTYAPEHMLNARLIYEKNKWMANLGANYVSSQFADLENTSQASANGLVGKIPSYTIWDLTLNYSLTSQARAFASARNLFDKEYISSRAPTGIFPGMGRMLEVGFEQRF